MRSVEYMNQKAIITTILPSNFVVIEKDGRVRIKRGKTALQGLENILDKIDTIEHLQQREGTAIDQEQKYLQEYPQATIQDVRRMALRNFEKTKSSDNFFYELARELNITNMFKSRKGLTGQAARDKYREIVDNIVLEYEKTLLNHVVGNTTPYKMNKNELLSRMQKRGKKS